MDIQKLTKKNQEFIHIATNQLIKDGKSDQEIKDILGNVIPELIENQKTHNPSFSVIHWRPCYVYPLSLHLPSQ